MLKRLRLKFICVNMAIVTLMLAVIFGLVLQTTRQNIERENLRIMQSIAMSPFQLRRPNERPEGGGLPYFVLQIGPRGELEAISGSDYRLSDAAFLRKLVDAVFISGGQTGLLRDYHLRFFRLSTPTGHRLVFADTFGEQQAVSSLVWSLALIGGASFLAFLLLSLLLARWAVQPVERAWTQQRQFVSDASHELKTPLTVILTNAELLNDADCDEMSRQRSVRSILAMSSQMRELVEQLLDLARIDSGVCQAAVSEVDFSRVVQDALLPFEPLFFEKELTLTSQLEPGLRIKGSPGHLSQVVNILLDNAQKYATSPGSVRVTLCRHGKAFCLLQVANQGEPLSGEELRDIFKRFYRGDKVRSMSHSYGLGLSIASGIVQAHRGRIWAESGGGVNTFSVRLPLAPAGV